MLIEVTLCLTHGNRKITTLLNYGTDEDLISQRFTKKNSLEATPVERMGTTVDGHRITIYRSYNIITKAKDSRSEVRATQRTFYAADMQYYDVILGWSWLDQVNPDVWWPDRRWFYRKSHASLAEEVPAEEFRKGLAEDTTVYVFYGHPAEVPRRSYDENDITIYSVGTELTLPSEYEDFEDVFSKKECETVPGSTRVTHIIDLEEGTEPPFGPIYSLSERELRILRDYLAEKEAIG